MTEEENNNGQQERNKLIAHVKTVLKQLPGNTFEGLSDELRKLIADEMDRRKQIKNKEAALWQLKKQQDQLEAELRELRE